jgi:hypothetical protein
MAGPVAPALRALLERSLDYAGLFPPASLPLEGVCERYGNYRRSEHRWILNRLVVPVNLLGNAALEPDWPLTVLAETPFEASLAVASVETRSLAHFPVRTYREIALAAVPEIDCWKIRTGGITPQAIPCCEELAGKIVGCARRGLACKVTAGLHHALRGEHPLTYEAESPRACLHGFINVFMAAAIALNRAEETEVCAVLEETEAQAFSFSDQARWRDRHLSLDRIRSARREFLHSFGSCSFEEPVAELQALGWI